ncbi:hypothetical protein PAMP_003517 [Pampus punctatissimus]
MTRNDVNEKRLRKQSRVGYKAARNLTPFPPKHIDVKVQTGANLRCSLASTEEKKRSCDTAELIARTKHSYYHRLTCTQSNNRRLFDENREHN